MFLEKLFELDDPDYDIDNSTCVKREDCDEQARKEGSIMECGLIEIYVATGVNISQYVR